MPLVRAEAPYIGTGIEARAARDAADMILAEDDGTVTEVDGDSITVEYKGKGKKVYRLLKFERSNQDTCINQKPRVREGDRSRRATILADGPSTENGELALGKNLLVAFMPWEGYNFEDAIILSERLVQDDVLTSIHIHEHEIDARDTKLGPEEITRDIPNLSEEILADLDERGIIRVGAEVGPGDVLVGKVTPKGETELTPEERLLRAIFGEKAREVRDTSLKVPHGETGQGHRRQGVQPRREPRAAAGRQPAGAGVRRPEAQDQRGRQARRPPRQQGRDLQDPARRGHAVHGRRHAGRHHPQPARRPVPHERRPGARGAPRLRRPLGLGRSDGIGVGDEPVRGTERKTRTTTRAARLIATPVFDGAHWDEEDEAGKHPTIQHILENLRPEAHRLRRYGDGGRAIDRRSDGKATLYNGRTGEAYDNPITVGSSTS